MQQFPHNDGKTHTDGRVGQQQESHEGKKVHVGPAATAGLLIQTEMKKLHFKGKLIT